MDDRQFGAGRSSMSRFHHGNEAAEAPPESAAAAAADDDRRDRSDEDIDNGADVCGCGCGRCRRPSNDDLSRFMYRALAVSSLGCVG